jgi:hypothetical protein
MKLTLFLAFLALLVCAVPQDDPAVGFCTAMQYCS